MLFSYLKNRKQRVRLNITYSELIQNLFSALQGAILNAVKILLQQFTDKRIKINPDKYHLLINNTKKVSKKRLVAKKVLTTNMKGCQGSK